MNLSSQLWEVYFLYMNLSSQLWEIYSQDKPEKNSHEDPPASPKAKPMAGRHKEYLLLFFLSALVTWWQKENG